MPKKNKNFTQSNTLTRLFSRLKNGNGMNSTENDQFKDIDRIAPLKKKIELLNAKKEKSPEEKIILISAIVLLIDRLNAKAEKNPEDGITLGEMLALLKELANKTPSKTDEVVVEKRVVVEAVSQEIASILEQQLRSVKLKPVKKNEVQKEHAKPAKEENDPPVFVINKTDLASINLKSVKRVNSVTSSHDEVQLTELEIKFAERRALIERKTVNTSSAISEESSSGSDGDSKLIIPVLEQATYPNFSSGISDEGSGSDSEEDVDEFNFMENICNAPGFFGGSRDIPQFINRLSKIYEDQTTMDELDELLKTLQAFINEPDDEPVIVEAIVKPKI
ncbi:hypothetical protein [Rickettsiella endosymbiont of Miltochrista miniata]|uniref:hypothetical protein n=1 Tax=Rickettsiella endosymbiont of Miltochrista miniata TaxID=3066239 RepID=UPI00313ABC5C